MLENKPLFTQLPSFGLNRSLTNAGLTQHQSWRQEDGAGRQIGLRHDLEREFARSQPHNLRLLVNARQGHPQIP